MRTLALLALFVACQREASPPPKPTGSATVHSPAADPWAASPSPGSAGSAAWPPSLLARHERAERICPTVTPYFFEIAKHGKVSHILGTRHVSVPFSKMPEVVHDELHRAKLAVFEVAPDDTSTFTAPTEPLRDELGSADWQHFTELAGVEAAAALEHGTAAAATLELAIGLEDISALLDKQIQDEAERAGIPERGLETAEFQDHVLAKLLDVRMLRATVETTKDRAELDRDAEKDLRSYCDGSNDAPGTDAETRAKLKHAGYTDAEIDAEDDVLVYARNRDWIPKLEALFAKGDVFVAVGADHLLGDKGVIALLRKRGYATKRIVR